MSAAPARATALDPELALPLTLLARYVFFLSRRPISAANRHFLVQRAAGLRPLATLIPRGRDARLETLAADVRGLTGANVGRLAERLTQELVPRLPRAPADDVLLTSQPPPASLLGRTQHVRLLLGPGIGLGDEVVCAALPAWLADAAPQARIEVLSTRPELWHGVTGVASVARYDDALELLRALRARDGALVMLADFEKPALAAALTREPGAPDYVELSLGARSVSAFDARARCLYERPLPAGQGDDYYRFAELALRFLGARASLRRAAPVARARGAGPLVLGVSPFTSKHEPSGAAWSALLSALLPEDAAAAVRLRFDPGPNVASARFAAELARATRARAAGRLECELAGGDEGRTLDLAGLLRLLQTCDAVVCADSFAAHAAARAGCVTLVVASEALQAWRVPHAPAFYFDDRERPERLAGGMRRVLAALEPGCAGPGQVRPWDSPSLNHTRATLDALARALDDEDGALGALLDAYEAGAHAARALAAECAGWPAEYAPLLADRDYPRLLPALTALRAHGLAHAHAHAVRVHVARLVAPWENSNLAKFLALTARARLA